jgi:hypothetical protein
MRRRSGFLFENPNTRFRMALAKLVGRGRSYNTSTYDD